MMKKIWNWLKIHFGASSEKQQMKSVLDMVAHTQEHELTCDEVHNLIDQFAEMILRGEDASHIMPLVQQHLDMCPDCREEYEVLLQALQVDQR